MTEEQARWYLAGLFDGEGSSSVSRRKGRPSFNYIVRIDSTDFELLDVALEACTVLGIKAGVYRSTRAGKYKDGSTRKECRVLAIQNKAGIRRFAEMVPFKHIRRREKMEGMIASWPESD